MQLITILFKILYIVILLLAKKVSYCSSVLIYQRFMYCRFNYAQWSIYSICKDMNIFLSMRMFLDVLIDDNIILTDNMLFTLENNIGNIQYIIVYLS